MKNIFKRGFSIMCALFVLLSVVAMAVPSAYATEAGEEERLSFSFLAEDIKLPYSDAGMCDSVVEDPDSQHGKAVRLSYDERYATGDAGLYNVMVYPVGAILSFYTCDGKEGKPAGFITSEQLQENALGGKYVTYKFNGVDMTGATFMYIFNCWGLQIRFTDDQLSAMQNKLLQVSVSLKVTGDVTNPAKNPTYYFDEIIVAEADPNEVHIHAFGEWKPAGDYNHEAQCTVDGCTETQSEEHDWGEAEVTKEPSAEADGEMTYTCKVCKGTRTKKLPYSNGSSNSSANTQNNGVQKQPTENGWILYAAIGMFAFSVIIIVLALVLSKRNKK